MFCDAFFVFVNLKHRKRAKTRFCVVSLYDKSESLSCIICKLLIGTGKQDQYTPICVANGTIGRLNCVLTVAKVPLGLTRRLGQEVVRVEDTRHLGRPGEHDRPAVAVGGADGVGALHAAQVAELLPTGAVADGASPTSWFAMGPAA